MNRVEDSLSQRRHGRRPCICPALDVNILERARLRCGTFSIAVSGCPCICSNLFHIAICDTSLRSCMQLLAKGQVLRFRCFFRDTYCVYIAESVHGRRAGVHTLGTCCAGHNGCFYCLKEVQACKPECPLCRTSFPDDFPLRCAHQCTLPLHCRLAMSAFADSNVSTSQCSTAVSEPAVQAQPCPAAARHQRCVQLRRWR
jgi:hypothetical protein